jgi:1-acyl-sn-glycerol-3-phosphate acyltransferase
MRLPSKEFWSTLTWTERAACLAGAGIAHTRIGRRAATWHQDHVSVPVLSKTINDRLSLHGAEHMPRDAGFILAANHRSYFDLYAVLIATWGVFERSPHLYCPVRTTFFYERPLGVLLNLAVCANAMYPPVFRDDRGPTLNRYAIDEAVRLLEDDARTVIAIHPEGRRNTDPDPYTYLPAKSGVGRIGLRSRSPIIPVFVGGLPPTFPGLVKERMSGHGTPVRVRMGAPVDVADLYGEARSSDAQRAASDRVMRAVAVLGEDDRAYMADRRESDPSGRAVG